MARRDKTSPQAKWRLNQERQLAQRRLRADIIENYGGVCVCCGESNWGFLSLDHKFNDGAAERRKFGNGFKLMRHIKRIGYPTDRYQLLCFNCNSGKQYNGGMCPHEGYKEGTFKPRSIKYGGRSSTWLAFVGRDQGHHVREGQEIQSKRSDGHDEDRSRIYLGGNTQSLVGQKVPRRKSAVPRKAA